MMAKIVTLNRARKARTRTENRKAADANAARHGLTRAEMKLESARRKKATLDLDAHRREAGLPPADTT